MFQSYLSKNCAALKEEFNLTATDLSDANYIIFLATKFGEHVESLHTSTDNWAKANALFLSMSKELFTFIDAYRCGDSPGIEFGYEIFAPVWRALGQSRYLERYWRQLELMLLRCTYQDLEQFREHRTICNYPGETGKSTTAQDEACELCNRVLALLSVKRTLKGFIDQSKFVGLTLMAKRFNILLHCLRDREEEVYRSGSESKTEPEKMLIYEVFARAETARIIPGRDFPVNLLRKQKDSLLTKLSDKKLQNSMADYESDEAFRLLSSIGQILDNPSAVDEDSDNEEDGEQPPPAISGAVGIDIGDPVEPRSVRLEAVMDDDANRTTDTTPDEPDDTEDTRETEEVSKKLGYNRFAINSPWIHGKKLLKKDDIKSTRQNKYLRNQRKRSINKIVATFNKRQTDSSNFEMKEERNVAMPPWTNTMMKLYPHLYEEE